MKQENFCLSSKSKQRRGSTSDGQDEPCDDTFVDHVNNFTCDDTISYDEGGPSPRSPDGRRPPLITPEMLQTDSTLTAETHGPVCNACVAHSNNPSSHTCGTYVVRRNSVRVTNPLEKTVVDLVNA